MCPLESVFTADKVFSNPGMSLKAEEVENF